MSSYRLKDGLLGLPTSDHGHAIDHLLETEITDAQDRRFVLMNHKMLAVHTDWHVRYWGGGMAVDDVGERYVPLPRGGRAYTVEHLFGYLDGRKHLDTLTGLVRDAMFHRFVKNVNECRREA